MQQVMFTNPATVLGILMLVLGAVFYTHQSHHPFWRKFYSFVPALLLCYFIPSLLNSFEVIDGSDNTLYYVASRYLLPASLVLLTLKLDLRAIARLGPKAIIMFFTGTLGIVIGAPIALLVTSAMFPDLLGGHGPDAVWRGMTTVAGSWIGGGANQTAMKEIYGVGDTIFSAMIAVDVIVANLWMAVLLFMAGRAKRIDAGNGADASAIEALKEKMSHWEANHARIPHLNDLMFFCAIAFGVTGLAHFGADLLAPYFADNYPELQRYSLHSKFFWLIVIATTVGIALSMTRAAKLEEAGASKIGSAFIYVLVATIGMHMDIRAIIESPVYFLLGGIWMLVHASLMLLMAKLIKAPLFYMAVGSQANVGGAASAPVVASAFHPSLAPVGVLLAVLGYAVGTYMAWFCGQILQTLAVG
ncbi:Uncharacterized membrane protein [Ferrimonas sediminum]|uniref:Uncharacterized membrane protein n=1 Tax=Ferrimonas sediminum TaxID=718193 RepID=A0A1G8QIS6_9GAMM|nr:DUF819 family protein [Ferrimonas sediminum]SDJ04295.1 Uncharacterized membrane protein [Ferrimonas sediminum]